MKYGLRDNFPGWHSVDNIFPNYHKKNHLVDCEPNHFAFALCDGRTASFWADLPVKQRKQR